MGNPLYKPRPERWPQFSLRGLLIVVTLTGLLLPTAVAQYRAWHFRQEQVRRRWERFSGPCRVTQLFRAAEGNQALLDELKTKVAAVWNQADRDVAPLGTNASQE